MGESKPESVCGSGVTIWWAGGGVEERTTMMLSLAFAVNVRHPLIGIGNVVGKSTCGQYHLGEGGEERKGEGGRVEKRGGGGGGKRR